MRRVFLLARLDPDRQPVLRRRERAGRVRREDARRVVGLVEVEHGPAVRGRWDVDESAAAVRLAAVRQSPKTTNQSVSPRSRTVRGAASGRRLRRRARREMSRSRPCRGRWARKSTRGIVGLEPRLDPPGRVHREVGSSRKSRRAAPTVLTRTPNVRRARPAGSGRPRRGARSALIGVGSRRGSTRRPGSPSASPRAPGAGSNAMPSARARSCLACGGSRAAGGRRCPVVVPTAFSPSPSQKSPTSASQPSSAVSRAIRRRRQASMSAA